jgi:excisionase family DNA binding protein
MSDRLLTVAEAAELLRTTERFPRRLIAERRIRFTRVGRHVRIPESAVREFVLGNIREGDIRRWRKERLTAGPKHTRPFGPVTVAKAYRLLHAIMTTAVEDGMIRRNPCNITGAGQEHSDERPVIPVGKLVELLDNVPARYRALLLLATFANLRFGELAGLRRDHLDLDACEVRVTASLAELDDGRLAYRQYDGGRAGCQPQGTDGADGSLEPARRPHLPPRHPRTRPEDSGRNGQALHRRQEHQD